MADVNANIGVHIDTSAALAELKNLQRQLATFHASVSKGSAASAMAQKNLQTNLLNSINATGKFTAQMGVVRTSTESFTHALEKNKLGMREYFRYAGGATKTFGRLFKQEFDTINKVAEDRVKKMQTQYIKMGRDASGAMKAMAIQPTTLNMKDYATQTAMAAQKQALFNQLVRQGSTNLLNFGKNTQWAGRQLMVGFTIPLAYLGTAAAKTFMDLEKQALKFKRVYGDMFTTSDETNKALEEVQKLAEGFTKYGVAVAETMEMAASAAAMGKTGADLTAQVAQATRLAVLGGVEQEQALETTISLTNAFGIAAEDLANKINFLNSVENQTVVSIEDLTIAIPKAGPVVQQLGGDVEDLAFFLTAMKEGGINASEGANALKSGLASLINPSKKASAMLSDLGINIKAIVEGNNGNIRQTVIDFSRALDTLDPLNRARAIEQLFGKFQFSRLSTLFQNVTKDGTQAAKVLGLAGASIEELAILSERELKTVEDAVGTQFKAAVEDLKVTLAPIGKEFLKAVTPIVKVIGNLLERFDSLGEGTKKFIVIATSLVGIIGPVLLMTFGLLANGAANIIKLFLALRVGFAKLGGNSKILAEQTNYMTTEQLEAATVAASLNQAHTRLTQSFTAETSAVRLLRQAYIDATVAAANFARANPGMMIPGRGKAPKKFARGSTYVPGTGNKDNVPSVLTPGEAVIPKDVAQDPRFQPIIDAMVSGRLQAFGSGSDGVQPFGNSPKFQSKLDLSGPSSQVLNSDPSQVNALVSGRGRQQVSPEEWEARRLKALARITGVKPEVEAAPLSKTVFAHAVDKRIVRGTDLPQNMKGLGFSSANAFSAIGFDLSPETNSNLIHSNVPVKKYISELNAPGSTTTMTARLIDLGLTPGEASKVTGQMKTNLLKSLSGMPENSLVGDKDIYSRMGNLKTGILGGLVKKSKTGRLGEGVKLLYSNTTFSPLGASSVSMNSTAPIGSVIDAVKKTKTSQQAIRALTNLQAIDPNYQVPVKVDAQGNIVAYERPEVSKKTGQISKTKTLAVLEGDKFRTGRIGRGGGRKLTPSKGAMQRAQEALMPGSLAVAKGEKVQTTDGKVSTVTGQTGTAKPSDVRTGSPRDRRVIPTKGVARVVPMGRGFRVMPGAVDGMELSSDGKPMINGKLLGGSATDILFQNSAIERKAAQEALAAKKAETKSVKGSIKIIDAEKQFRAEQNSLRRQIEKLEKQNVVQMKKEQRETKRQSTTRQQGNTNTRPQEMKSQNRMMKMQGVGMAAGMAATGAYMTGNTNVGNALLGLSIIPQLLTMVSKGVGIFSVTLIAAAAAALKFNRDVENARKEGVELGKSMSMTAEKLQGLAEITGTVSATELADRKRSTLLSGEDAVQRKFGQNILGSEFGKKLMSDIEAQTKGGRTVTQIGENVSNSLAYAVVQGVITGDQAKSISAALGEELKSYAIPAIVTGRLVNLLGFNGENLENNPLQVAIEIQKKSMQTQAEAFQSAISNRQDTRSAGGGLLLAGGAAAGLGSLAATGIGAPIAAVASVALIGKALYDQNKIKAANMKLDAAATEMGIQQIVMNNGLVDSLNKQYDQKLKTAKTEAEIKTIEDERSVALTKINDKNSDALDLLIEQKNQLSKGAFDKGISSAIDALYKEGPMKAFADQAKQLLAQGKESNFKTMLQVELASGGLDPLTVMKLIQNPNLETQYDVVVSTQGTKDTNMLFQLLMKSGIEDQKLPIMLDVFAKDPTNFDKNINALSTLANMQQKYGITINLNDDGPEQIQEVLDITSKLSGITGEELSKEVFFGLGVTGDMTAPEMDKLWTTLVGTSKTINKKVVVDFVAAGDRNVLDFYYKSMGITRLRGRSAAGQDKGFSDAASAYVVGRQGALEKGDLPGGGTPGGGSGGKRDTTFDDILNDLKRTRNATINAAGGAGELLRILGGKKDITIFNGLDQQLSKLGANSDFMDWVGGIDDAVRNKLIKVAKDGKVALTELGLAAKKAFDEKQLGLFSSAAQDQINVSKAQRASFIKLTNAGLATTDTLKLIEDGNLANAIANAKNSGEIKKVVEQEQARKKQMELTSAMTDPKTFLSEINAELDKQFTYQKKLMELEKSKTEAQISGDYIGAAIFGQEQASETSSFSKDIVDLTGKMGTIQNAMGLLGGIKDKAQRAQLQSTLGQGMLGLQQLGSFNPTFGYAPQFAGIDAASTFGNKPTSTTDTSSSVYNIQMTVNGNNATSDDIANQVIKKINLVAQRNNKTNSVGK
jgi:TP901 family phage tail tape measure protein